jgi:ABC-type uncharacterized transport system substrate-binding protein
MCATAREATVRAALVAFALFWILADPAAAEWRVSAVLGTQIRPHAEAFSGFKDACDGCDIQQIVAADFSSAELISEIREEKPHLIFAVGYDALNAVKAIKNIPIVYAMVLNPLSIPSLGDNVTGVSINLAPEKQLAMVSETLRGRKNIGIFFNPDKTGAFVRRFQQAAQSLGLRLIAREVKDPRDVPLLLGKWKNEVDLFWMIPDTTVVTPETVESLFLYSATYKVPVISFAEKYVEMGALLSLGIDAYDIGRQAGEIALKILRGATVHSVPRVDARKVVLTINTKVARKLGVSISEDVLKKSRVIN